MSPSSLIHTVEPSLNTLLLMLLVPFAYFGYHAKYWYRPATLKKADFLVMVGVIVLCAVVIIRSMRLWRESGDMEQIKLALMHLAPLILTLLSISENKRMYAIFARAAAGGGAAQPGGETDYTPMPVNREIERISWNEIIINEGLKSELLSVVNLLRDPKETRRYGIEVPKGILLTGPPGTGKTTIAKVMANEAGLNFFVLSMDAIVSKWVGESEKNLTKLFMAAKRAAPAVIFVDEVDSIGRGRSSSGAAWAENLLNHLLQLIDGVVKTEGLYVIAATNRADLVDDALKRAGRLNKVIHVPLPDFNARAHLFQLYLSRLPLESNIDLGTLAHLTESKSGADIKAICQQAGLNAFKREAGNKRKHYKVSLQDIEDALIEFMRQGPKPPPSDSSSY